METTSTAIFFFEYNYLSLELTESLYNAIKGFSIPRVYSSALTVDPNLYRNIFTTLQPFTFRFLPALFNFLKNSVRIASLLKCTMTLTSPFFRLGL